MTSGPSFGHIEKIHFKAIRGFTDLELSVTSADGSPRQITILIGKNGTCKTTLLRAIAMGLADPDDAQSLLAEPLGGMVSSRHSRAEVMLRLVETETSELIEFRRRLSRHEDFESIRGESRTSEEIEDGTVSRHSSLPPPHKIPDWPFVVGYGAGRFGSGVSLETSRAYRASEAVATLFRYERGLFGSELILRRLKDFLGQAQFSGWIRGVQRLLGLQEDDVITFRQGGGVFIQSSSVGGTIPLESWADGYRLTLNWLLDLYGWAMRADTIDEEGHISGILLIDEIEQHLHPSLQAEILPRLCKLLPKMQIFATTHSPLVVLDAKPEEVVVLRREGDEVVAGPIPDFRGYSAEDVLTDPRLFDTSEVYGSEKRHALEHYRKLSAIPSGQRSAKQSSELRRLADELREQQAPNSRESEVVRELRELVAKGRL